MKLLRNVIIKNMTDEQRNDVLLAMRETGKGTASQALLSICKGYARMVGVYKSNQQELERLRIENARLRKGLQTVLGTVQQLEEALGKEQ